MNLYAQRIAMSVAIVCMVNHTAVVMMRDAAHPSRSSSSSSDSIGGVNLTTATPGEWQKNESDDTVELMQSPCVVNLIDSGNRSRVVVIIGFLAIGLQTSQSTFFTFLKFISECILTI